MTNNEFKAAILQGIPTELPPAKTYDVEVSHAPIRKMILSKEEQKLALKNALRYFPEHLHKRLAPEFFDELKRYGRIYMYRYRPDYKIFARAIEDFPYKSKQAAAIMLMLSNNLDYAIAQHPHELITYGGNGAVFQNWAQYLLTMKYLATMTDEQTLSLYSGHPMGLFPSHPDAPRVVITNGMVIPNYSKPDHWEKFNALGVSQYGQMTAGSFMYIGPQGIVHGTTITVMNALRRIGGKKEGRLFISSGLGGMSGAQPKAAKIANCVSIVAEVNEKAIIKRHSQGWVDEIFSDLPALMKRVEEARNNCESTSFAFQGNIVDLWEYLVKTKIKVDIGSDQTSLHNPWSGGYYPVGYTFEEANKLMIDDPDKFHEAVQKSLRRHADAINKLAANGMYFFDYGNAFLLESSRAGADVMDNSGKFRYNSYIQDIMGTLYFDYGFGPFRWVCCSNNEKDLAETDHIAAQVLEGLLKTAPSEISEQLSDNLKWIQEADNNKLVVGSQARILYADAEGRIKIASAFNKAIKEGRISAPVVLGRDHHDVSGTDSPFRETSNIYDGSSFTADMAVHNVIGDSFRGATWVSLHNGGGVGWGESINGGFGMMIDGSADSERRLRSMLFWDVNNGITRRSWARNESAIYAIKRAMETEPKLKVTLPFGADDGMVETIISE